MEVDQKESFFISENIKPTFIIVSTTMCFLTRPHKTTVFFERFEEENGRNGAIP